jgi:hypothetical protein
MIFQKNMELSRQPANFREDLRRGVRLRMELITDSFQFLRSYWQITLLCASLTSGVGTMTGILPGTKKTRSLAPPPLPEQ